MPQLLDRGKASLLEEAKLVEELQALIEAKGLRIEVNVPRVSGPFTTATLSRIIEDNLPAGTIPGEVVMACPSCIACTCMICW